VPQSYSILDHNMRPTLGKPA